MDASARTIGIVLVVVGALLLLGQIGGLGAFAWPLFIVAPGALLLLAAFLGGDDAAGLAVPGAIVVTVGLVLWLQAITGRFETWSYAWGLVLASVGVGTFLEGSLKRDEEKQREGMRLAGLGLALFAAFGAFFELLIFGGLAGWLWRWGIPLALIAGGVLLLVRRAERGSGGGPGPRSDGGPAPR